MKRRKSIYAPEEEVSLDQLMPVFRDGAGRKLEIADWSRLPEAEAMNSELRTILTSAIQELPELYRSVVLLRDVEEMSTEEAAETLDVSPEVVKTRLHRARLILRQRLDRELMAVGGLR